jgi:hypothetical protein
MKTTLNFSAWNLVLIAPKRQEQSAGQADHLKPDKNHLNHIKTG